MPREDPVAGLIQELLAQVADDEVPVRDPGSIVGSRKVMLDREVGGARYVLLRIEPADFRDQVVLSPREREVARMVARGHANKTIAATLEISLWTVGTYLRRLFAKLGVNTRTEMVAKLIDLGVIANWR